LTRFLCFLPEQILFHRDKFEIWRQSKIGAGSETCEAISSFETNIIEFSNKASSENSILCRVRSLVLSLMTGERYANTNLYSNYILLIMKKRLGKLIRFATSMRSVCCFRSSVLSAIVKCSRRGAPTSPFLKSRSLIRPTIRDQILLALKDILGRWLGGGK
jgi:hypothetical protein